MYLSIEISRENDNFIAHCSELNITGSGPSYEKAIERLKSIIYFYMHSAEENKSSPENPDSSPIIH